MKKVLSFLLTAVILSAAASPAYAAPEKSAALQKKDVTAYLYGMDDKTVMTCLIDPALPDVPYIRAVDYLDQLYTVDFSCEKNSDGTYTVSNANGEMVVDVDADTIYFEDFDTFTGTDARDILEDETADYLDDFAEYELVSGDESVSLDLSAYGIDLVAQDGEVYFPLATINDIYAGTYHAALFIDGALYFADVMEDEPYYDDSPLYQTVTRDKALVEFSYNELCFTMDNFYGCPPSAKLAQAISEKGFDRAIAEYDTKTASAREMLLSEDLVDYCFGMLYLDEYLHDGGHTFMSYGLQLGMDSYPDSAFAEEFMEIAYDLEDGRLMKVMMHLQSLLNDQTLEEKLEKEREEAFAQLTLVKEWDDAAFYLSGDTGFFSFDEFKDAVVEPFKWSLDYAVENSVRNFVIDLSLNGGGSTAAGAYMLSVMCDYARMDICNRLADNQYYLIDTVDRNLDGEFDDRDDEVSYDLNFGVLTTQFSFSAANAMACQLQDCGVAVLGENSGGGTCAVSVHFDAAGYAYVLSDITVMTHPDGTDLDSGAKPDVKLPSKNASYKGFYDFAKISEGIEGYYLDHPRPVAPTEPAAVKGNTDGLPDVMLWILPNAVAGICCVIFLFLILRGAFRKKKY